MTGDLHGVRSIRHGPVDDQCLYRWLVLILHEPHNGIGQDHWNHQKREAASSFGGLPFRLGVVKGVQPMVDLLLEPPIRDDEEWRNGKIIPMVI